MFIQIKIYKISGCAINFNNQEMQPSFWLMPSFVLSFKKKKNLYYNPFDFESNIKNEHFFAKQKCEYVT